MNATIRRHHIDLFDGVVSRMAVAQLSELLPAVLRLAKLWGKSELVRWVRLELDGYVSGNPAMAEDITVPEYRAVVGQYYDDDGKRLVLQDSKLNFIFEDRLRFGVVELERLASSSSEIRVQRTHGIEIVRQHLKVPVTTYAFSPIAVSGILAAIRSELLDRITELEPEIDRSRWHAGGTAGKEQSASWTLRHIVPLVLTILGGLLVAYISYRMGWVG